ncbi:MAG: TIGR01777 family oxidoreductase [Candidatus Latescibacterota bacterium]|nr:TIGR01777 family oxidoreductase [Candidatus Latescibacterota bacterium]
MSDKHRRQITRRLRILVGGSTGLVGTALVDYLRARCHDVVPLARRAPANAEPHVLWDPAAGKLPVEALDGFDGIVHLGGANIAHGRWTAERKRVIRDSRVVGTRLLCESLARAAERPDTLVCASAIGYYGSRRDEIMREDATPGDDFLAEVAKDWEAATAPAMEAGIRVVNLRIGVVLTPIGAALKSMLLPFRFGLGGRIGSGGQYMSWVTLDDVVAVIDHVIRNESVSGPLNAVAPEPVTNAEFTDTLGRALHRPTLVPLPAFAVRLLFGEMGQALLLSSTRVDSNRLVNSGYHFLYPTLAGALEDLLKPH